MFLFGLVYCAASIAGLTGIGGCAGDIVACDAAAYYYADGYQDVPSTPQYGYSPAFLTLIAPLRLLPWEAFVWVWFGLHVAALAWLRAGWLLAIPGINEDVIRGNVTVFVALSVVIAMRYGSAWAFPLLTKVLPGVGVVWHAARQEWRQLAWAAGVTGGIVGIGLLVNASAWEEWVQLLTGAEPGVGLYVRVAVAIAVIAYAGRTSRAWLIPVGMIVAWSFITPPVLMMLAAVPRLRSFVASRDLVSVPVAVEPPARVAFPVSATSLAEDSAGPANSRMSIRK
jgi:hypothetical protein